MFISCKRKFKLNCCLRCRNLIPNNLSRRSKACQHCHVNKIKCSGIECVACQKAGVKCTPYISERFQACVDCRKSKIRCIHHFKIFHLQPNTIKLFKLDDYDLLELALFIQE